ncbi:MAG: group 1 glycosyl transferase [Parcubacteria group bacterium Gr01-1014_73]|nr:MAG: group 1 glycosyl transferase [Parcubacteria group bacterium Gr01-1014_73]
MKIYYVANVRWPTSKAHGIQLAKMSEALIEAGADLTLVVPNRGRGDAQAFYGLRRAITTIQVPVLNFGNNWLGFNLSALAFATSSFLFLLFRRLEKNAVIYTIDLDNFSFFLLPFLGRSVFIEVHGSKQLSFFSKFFFRKVSGIAAVSDGVKSSLIKNFNLSPGKIIVCPNGIDFRMFENLPTTEAARQKLNFPKGPVFLYAGRFYNWKGLDILPAAAEKVGERASIILVGGNAAEFSRITGEKKIPPNLIFVDTQPFSEIPLWLNAADFLLVTATKKDEYSYRETSPMKLFEYLATGKPIIAAKTPAISNVVSAEEVIFYEPDDTVDLIKQMNFVLNNQAVCKAKAQRALEKAKEFSWQKRTEKILALINEKIKK